jgi:ribosomal protein L19
VLFQFQVDSPLKKYRCCTSNDPNYTTSYGRGILRVKNNTIPIISESSLVENNGRKTRQTQPIEAEKMMQRFASLAGRRITTSSSTMSTSFGNNTQALSRHFASSSVVGSSNAEATEAVEDVMPFVHHGHRPRCRDYEKFKSPRKRASKMFLELNNEACAKSKEAYPTLWQDTIRVGDSVELKMVSQGGLKKSDKQELEKIRGVVLGIVNRGLGSSLVLRDVVYGLPIERRIPMYSPMIKEAKVLERNFIFKEKRKVKRAKLYYFRDRNPLLTKVSKY